MSDHKWHEIHDNLVGLASWLDDSEYCLFKDVSDCIYFFAKPWKWDREYDLWLLWRAAEGDPQKCERIIQALDEETTAEDLMAEWEEEKQ